MEPTHSQGFAQVNGRDTPEDPWEFWKSTIEQLWMVENRKLPEIVSLMKGNHGFDAVSVHLLPRIGLEISIVIVNT